MTELLLGIASAFWLGILTSISPCPLATNIAAISFVGRRVGSPAKVFLAGLLYTAGRALTYLVLGVLLVSSLLSAPYLSHFLQKYMNKVLGPVLILVGMVLVELIQINFSGSGVKEKMQKRVEALGMLGALLLGVIFALSFCPLSAALFFGSLLPLALQYESGVILPFAYGVATGLPVLVFAILIALGAKRVGVVYNKIVPFEKWARWITGAIFILVGVFIVGKENGSGVVHFALRSVGGSRQDDSERGSAAWFGLEVERSPERIDDSLGTVTTNLSPTAVAVKLRQPSKQQLNVII